MATRQPLNADQASAIVGDLRKLESLAPSLFQMKRANEAFSDEFRDAASEAIVRIANLDEYSWLDVDGYEERRDGDQFGRIIPGIRLVRDGLIHKRGLPMRKDETPFFPPPGANAVMYLTDGGPVFVPMDELPEPSREERRSKYYGQRRDAYAAHLAGQSVQVSISRALSWFKAERDEPGTIIHEAHGMDLSDTVGTYNYWQHAAKQAQQN